VSVEPFIDALCAEADATVRGLLRQAYERGFREALASAGHAASTGTGSATPEVGAKPGEEMGEVIAIAPPAAVPAGPDPSKVEWAGNDEDDDGQVEEDDPAEVAAHPVRPIPASAMVATLKKRIERTFELERFDIDVVICRHGDRTRRQLKGSARLSTYRKEEG